jgi:uncharacterized membrane protein YfcA
VTSGLDYGIAAGAGVLAGGINAMAGGGSLISFPVLQWIGLPAINANVTNLVALTPGYVAGSHGQRHDLVGQGRRIRLLGIPAGVGAVTGSILLVTLAVHHFATVVPYLILLACGALVVQPQVRKRLERRRRDAADPESVATSDAGGPLEWGSVFVCCVYGGFFGAGLGIMLLAVLGFFSDDSLIRVNALKQVLSLVVSACAAVFLSFTGHVVWDLAAVVAAASLLGGFVGGRLVRLIDPTLLRALVVCYGVGVAIHYWV